MSGTEANSYASKLHEQARSKAELSYSYWAAGQSQSTASYQEKKLTAEELQEQAKREKAASSQGVSVWNEAGTFEERDCTAFAKQQLQVLLVGLEHSTPGGLLRLNELMSIEGEATVWVVRGSKRAGFDFTIEAAWCLGGEGSRGRAEGSVKLPGITPDDLDEIADIMEVTVDKPGDLQEPDVRKHIRGCSLLLAERLGKLQQLLKTR